MIVKERDRTSSRQTPAARSTNSGAPYSLRILVAPNTVWNGKRLDFTVSNNESVPRWGSIQVDGLDELECELKSNAAGFAVVYPGDRVALPPQGQVVFSLTINSQRTEPYDFKVYGFRHFTESRQDGGTRGLDKEYRWVPPPSERDFEIELSPDETVLRPWHRWGFGRPKAQVAVTNLSYMDVKVRPSVYKGEKPGEGRAVSELSEQVIAPGMSRTWSVAVKPGKRDRNEDFSLSAAAAILPPEGVGSPLRILCEQVTFVEYVPFLRRWYDWVLLIGSGGLALLMLVWILWGIPMWGGTDVRIRLSFHENSDTGRVVYPANWQQIHVELKSKDEPLMLIPADRGQSGVYGFRLPPRWLGMHWPFAWWNSLSTEPQPYKLVVTPSAAFQAKYNIEPTDPLRIAYADDNRKLFDRIYHREKPIEMPLIVNRKPGDRQPPLAAGRPNTGLPKDSHGGKGDGHDQTPDPKTGPTPRPPKLPILLPTEPEPLPNAEQQKELQYWCERLGYQGAMFSLRSHPYNPNHVNLIVAASNPDKLNTATVSIAASPECWLMLYATVSGNARQLIGMEKDPTGVYRVVIDPISESEGGRPVEIGAVTPEQLGEKSLDLSGLKGHEPFEYVVVAVSGIADMSKVKGDLRHVLGLLNQPTYKDARISVCGWRGEWQETQQAYDKVSVPRPATH